MVLHISEISKILKREYPFLLLDGVTDIIPNLKCCAYKNLSYNEWFFPVHFPDQPIMPGTLQLEAFTQAVALPLLVSQDKFANIPIILAGIDKVRFYKSVVPGDRLEILVTIDRIINDVAMASVTGNVNDEKVSECKITYKLVGQNNG